MARAPQPTAAKVSQDDPTAPRPIDANGRTLDSWNLPLNGPARARELKRLGKPDPNVDPAAWDVPAGDVQKD